MWFRPKQFVSTPTKNRGLTAMFEQTSAFKSGNFDDRKQASYNLRKSIKAAKRQYKNKVEEQFNTNNARSMWQGINNITDCKGNKPATVNIATSLPDELNLFYARFEAHNHTESGSDVFELPLSVCGSLMLQKSTLVPIPKEK